MKWLKTIAKHEGESYMWTENEAELLLSITQEYEVTKQHMKMESDVSFPLSVGGQ